MMHHHSCLLLLLLLLLMWKRGVAKLKICLGSAKPPWSSRIVCACSCCSRWRRGATSWHVMTVGHVSIGLEREGVGVHHCVWVDTTWSASSWWWVDAWVHLTWERRWGHAVLLLVMVLLLLLLLVVMVVEIATPSLVLLMVVPVLLSTTIVLLLLLLLTRWWRWLSGSCCCWGPLSCRGRWGCSC